MVTSPLNRTPTHRPPWVDAVPPNQVVRQVPRSFRLTGWNNGNGHFGLKIARRVRDRELGSLKVALGEGPYVTVVLPGIGPVCVHITPSFWTTCSELRSAEIGAWMKRRGDAPWPRGHPPKYLGEFRGRDNAPKGGTATLCVRPSAALLACYVPFRNPCSTPRSEWATDALPAPVLDAGAARNHPTYTALRAARYRFTQRHPTQARVLSGPTATRAEQIRQPEYESRRDTIHRSNTRTVEPSKLNGDQEHRLEARALQASNPRTCRRGSQ